MDTIRAEVLAVIVALVDGEPCVLVLDDPLRLPAGPLLPGHHSLQAATRAWVEAQTGRTLGYLEQLYTFIDVDRDSEAARRLSISYLGLTTDDDLPATRLGRWRRWYELFPWEDRRRPGPSPVAALLDWTNADPAHAERRRSRVRVTFGLDGQPWQPDLALQRYELLYEAGLLPESPDSLRRPGAGRVAGDRMLGDHRRVLATGISRLRAKIQYRPVVFELLPGEFTLRELQARVEALAGFGVHTQNFRRLVDSQGLVEETDGYADTGGRPARLYRFHRDVLQERSAAGTKLPVVRGR